MHLHQQMFLANLVEIQTCIERIDRKLIKKSIARAQGTPKRKFAKNLKIDVFMITLPPLYNSIQRESKALSDTLTPIYHTVVELAVHLLINAIAHIQF